MDQPVSFRRGASWGSSFQTFFVSLSPTKTANILHYLTQIVDVLVFTNRKVISVRVLLNQHIMLLVCHQSTNTVERAFHNITAMFSIAKSNGRVFCCLQIRHLVKQA